MVGRGSCCPCGSLTADTPPLIPGSLSLWGAHPGPQWAPAAFPLPAGPLPGPRPRPAPQPDPPQPQQASGVRFLRGAGGRWPGQGYLRPRRMPFLLLWPARPAPPGWPCHLVATVGTAGWLPSGRRASWGVGPSGLAPALRQSSSSPAPTSGPCYNSEAAAGLSGFKSQPSLFLTTGFSSVPLHLTLDSGE